MDIMKAQSRFPFQGVWNIVRFNWHIYLIAGLVSVTCAGTAPLFGPLFQWAIWLGVAAALGGIAVSLLVSHYVYDRSNLYELPWLDASAGIIPDEGIVVIIHAGFDEISDTLREKFPSASIHLWDFYDPAKHTEVSIRRARAAYPPARETVSVATDRLPMDDATADMICLMMAAHEIRDPGERRVFFGELHRILRKDGIIWVTEHLRDVPNFLAYSIGFLHFYSRAMWLASFRAAGLALIEERKVTALVSAFLLKNH